MQGHNPLQVLRQMQAPSRLTLGEGLVFKRVGVGQVIHIGQQIA